MTSTPACKCGIPCVQKTSRTLDNPDRPFWTCSSTAGKGCGFFLWAAPKPSKAASSSREPSGSSPLSRDECYKCCAPIGHLTRTCKSNTNGNAGREFYKCLQCDHFQWLTSATAAAAAPPQATGADAAATPDDAELDYYVVDPDTLAAVQQLFDVDGAKLGAGRDVVGRQDHDSLEVVTAWRIKNPQRLATYEAFRQRVSCAQHHQPVELRSKHVAAAHAVLASPAFGRDARRGLDNSANEALMLHGTKPDHLHKLLFEGLDPDLAKKGLFGRGTYLAEHAAKSMLRRSSEPSLQHTVSPGLLLTRSCPMPGQSTSTSTSIRV